MGGSPNAVIPTFTSSPTLSPKYIDPPIINQENNFLSCPACSTSVSVSWPTNCTPSPRLSKGGSINIFEEKGLKVSPNPASEFLIIENNEISQTIKIISLFGKIEMILNIKEGDYKIDVSGLSAGLYFLKTESNNSYKFIKL